MNDWLDLYMVFQLQRTHNGNKAVVNNTIHRENPSIPNGQLTHILPFHEICTAMTCWNHEQLWSNWAHSIRLHNKEIKVNQRATLRWSPWAECGNSHIHKAPIAGLARVAGKAWSVMHPIHIKPITITRKTDGI